MNSITNIVPVHSHAAVVLGTLTSVERSIAYLHNRDSGHRHLPCDLVVVDDGSKDETHDLAIFRAIEDVFYNRAINLFFNGVQSPLKTVRYTRSPGNSFDRQYEKFCVGFGQFRERESAERKLQVAVANLLSQYHLSRLEHAARQAKE